MKGKIRKIGKGMVISFIVILIVLGILYAIDMYRMKQQQPVLFSTWGRKYKEPLEESSIDTQINIVTSLEDNISNNTAWCGTFNLIWNDLKNDLAKQDIVFTPQLEIVENLNKGTFHSGCLSEDSYYKVYGTPSLELKEEIEKAIKKKFNETSEILDEFDWENRDPKDYFLYAMLKKEFTFPKEFTKLDNGTFGNYENVKYFGIDEETDEKVRDQVEVLYYQSEEDFAVKLLTKSNDEVILAKGTQADTFGDIYTEITQKTKNSNASSSFYEGDILKIPYIQFDVKEEIEELQEKSFLFANGDTYEIEKALQTIEFELDEKGGKIKSEAGMMVKAECMIERTTRKFILDDTFTIFLIEKEKELPYFAAKITDISQVQSHVLEIQVVESNKVEQMYQTIIDDIMEQDTALQYDMQYIALDVDSFVSPIQRGSGTIEGKYMGITEEEKEALLNYCKKYHSEVKGLSLQELKDQGLYDEERMGIDGIAIFISGIEKCSENEAVMEVTKYRSGLGAVMIKYQLNYKNDQWNIKALQTAIS